MKFLAFKEPESLLQCSKNSAIGSYTKIQTPHSKIHSKIHFDINVPFRPKLCLSFTMYATCPTHRNFLHLIIQNTTLQIMNLPINKLYPNLLLLCWVQIFSALRLQVHSTHTTSAETYYIHTTVMCVKSHKKTVGWGYYLNILPPRITEDT